MLLTVAATESPPLVKTVTTEISTATPRVAGATAPGTFCGDGTAYLDVTRDTENPNARHACDDANDDDADACTSDCAWNVCGDGLVFSKGYGEQYDRDEDGNELDDNPNPTEECDDGNDDAG